MLVACIETGTIIAVLSIIFLKFYKKDPLKVRRVDNKNSRLLCIIPIRFSHYNYLVINAPKCKLILYRLHHIVLFRGQNFPIINIIVRNSCPEKPQLTLYMVLH